MPSMGRQAIMPRAEKGRRWWFALVDLIRVLRVVCDSYNQLAPDARSLVHYSLRTAVRNSFIRKLEYVQYSKQSLSHRCRRETTFTYLACALLQIDGAQHDKQQNDPTGGGSTVTRCATLRGKRSINTKAAVDVGRSSRRLSGSPPPGPTSPLNSCWHWFPSGCPCQQGTDCYTNGWPPEPPSTSWTRDQWGEENGFSGHAGCLERVGHKNAWCGVSDVMMHFAHGPSPHAAAFAPAATTPTSSATAAIATFLCHL